jgi:hypothetical protein
MLQGVTMRYRVIALTLPLALSLSALLAIQVAAQDSPDTSVADAARRAQEQKKVAPKPAKLITNDNLPAASKSDATTTSAPDSSTQLTTTDATPPPAAPAAGAAQPDNAPANPEVAALKRQIADQQKQVDLLLRLNSLDQDAFLSNPDHAKDLQGKAKLDAQQEEIHAKVAALATLKAKLDSIAPGESAKASAPPKP